MTEQLKQAAQAALNACERIVDQEDSPVQFGIDFRSLGSSLRRALTTSQPAQAGGERVEFEAWTKTQPHGKYPLRRDQEGQYLADVTEGAWDAYQAGRAYLPTQPAAQDKPPLIDSMGMPTSCGKPLCSPDEHHPLCRLHKPAAHATPKTSRRFTSDIESSTVQAALSAKFGATPTQQAAGEPVGEPTFTQLRQILDGLARLYDRDSKAEFLRVWIRDWTQHKLGQATHPAPAVPEDVQRNAARWNYAMDWGNSGFAVCRRVGATGTCWEPIKTSGPLDAALAAAQAKGGEHA